MTDPAGWPDLPALRGLLADAYDADPLTAWIFPDEAVRGDAAAAWYGLFAEQYVASARATVIRDAGSVVAAALWRMPSDPRLSASGRPSIGGLLTALVGRERSAAIGEALHTVGSLTPAEPHVYLNFLAVCPERKRRGLGRRVLAPVIEAASSAGLPLHLETSNPANHGFYAGLGFTTTGEVSMGPGAPSLRAFRLPPSPAAGRTG